MSQNLNIPSMTGQTQETLPPKMEAAFEDTINMYRGALAPGAVARLRKQTEAAFRGRQFQTSDALVAGLVSFLEGDDHREAKDRDDIAAAKAADPRLFFLPDHKADKLPTITAVLRRIANLKPESRQAIEAELADRAFGKSAREVTELVLKHLQLRENWPHLVTQPPLPYGEAKARMALDPYRSQLADYEGLARKWARHLGDMPQHRANFWVAEMFRKDGTHFKDGEVRKYDPYDPDFKPQKLSEADQSIADQMRASGMYRT